MESANLYEHHQQQQQQQLQPGQLLYSSLASSSSSSSSPGVSALHDWNPSVVLDGYEFNRYMTEILPNSPSLKSSSLQEMRFGHVHPSANGELQFYSMKGSISDNFLKLSDMNSSNFNSSYSYTRNKEQDQDEAVEHHEKLSWFKSYPEQKLLLSRQSYLNGESESFARFGVLAPAASSFRSSCTDQNSSNLYGSTSLLSSSSSPSLQLAADHILSYNTNKVEGSNRSFEERNSLSYFHVQQSNHSPSNSSNKTSKFRNEVPSSTEKLSGCSSIHEVVVAKKPRLSSSPCPTLKVRKEKLGDRIAALHRMVSPFGKTDTASVLTEAIGYIQFLQDQIQTLTMSYLKSSRNKSRRNTRGDSTMKNHDHHNQKEDERGTYQDLRSRGLRLIPLSFTSYICSSYNGNI